MAWTDAKYNRELFRIIKVEGEDILSTDEYDTPQSDSEIEYTSEERDVEVDQTIDGKEDNYIDIATQFMHFIDSCPTTYHVTQHIGELLRNHGFTYLHLKQDLRVTEPGAYYTQRDDLTLVAFIIGANWKSINGSCFVASHIDALSVKVNPANSITSDVDGYNLLNVQPYSGSLNSLWLNRDLGLAGALLVRENGKIIRKLVKSPIPIGFIPILAEHFGIERPYNKQTEMKPIVGASDPEVPTNDEKNSPLFNKHPLALLRYISKLSQTAIPDILQIDLDLYDTQQASKGGLDGEFIYSTSLDDRLCAYASILGLLQSKEKIDFDTYDGLIGCYLANHEEIGSRSRTGAYSGLLKEVMTSMVSSKTNVAELSAQLFTNSIILSSDVTHAFNPNFKDIYLENHLPLLNTGPVVKIDSNMHVLSDSLSHIFLQQLIDQYLPDLKLQVFHIRNDSRSGGTIGPIMGSGTNINGAKIVVDVGIPILSMHSIRSICGYKDVGIGARFYQTTFDNWSKVIGKIEGK